MSAKSYVAYTVSELHAVASEEKLSKERVYATAAELEWLQSKVMSAESKHLSGAHVAKRDPVCVVCNLIAENKALKGQLREEQSNPEDPAMLADAEAERLRDVISKARLGIANREYLDTFKLLDNALLPVSKVTK